MEKSNVRKFKKSFQPNVAFIIIILILVYIFGLAWNYFTKEHISIYEVNTSEISDDSPVLGYVMRQEEVVNANNEGYINFYNAEGNRIKVNDVVYTLDKTGRIQDMIEQLKGQKASKENIKKMRDTIASFENSFNLSDYQSVKTLNYSVNNNVLEQSSGNLYGIIKNELKNSNQSDDYSKYKSNKTGVLAYSYDGYESKKIKDVNDNLFKQYGNVTHKQIENSQKISAGDPAYRLITSNTWSIICKLNDNYYNELKARNSIRIVIEKDHLALNASISLFNVGSSHFVKLTTNRYMERYLNERFLKIDFKLKSAKGLKIANSSIIKRDYFVIPKDLVSNKQKEKTIAVQIIDENGQPNKKIVSLKNYIYANDKYYVTNNIVKGGDFLSAPNSKTETYIISSKEQLYGVYCVNEGFCKFKPIEILYQNKEYTICSEYTQNGLAAYDHIVVDPTKLSEDDFIT